MARWDLWRIVSAGGECERIEIHATGNPSLGIHRRSDKNLDGLARMFGPIIRGWINYYSHFYKSALYPSLQKIDDRLVAWTRRKFKRFRQRPKAAWTWLARTIRKTPELFPHWRLRYARSRLLGAV